MCVCVWGGGGGLLGILLFCVCGWSMGVLLGTLVLFCGWGSARYHSSQSCRGGVGWGWGGDV